MRGKNKNYLRPPCRPSLGSGLPSSVGKTKFFGVRLQRKLTVLFEQVGIIDGISGNEAAVQQGHLDLMMVMITQTLVMMMQT